MRQRILITGASSGLGAGMARRFVVQGRDVALCARRTDKLEELRNDLLELRPDAGIVATRRLDVDDRATIAPVFDELAEELGGLDRIIVNAGIGLGGPIGTTYAHHNAQTIQTNLLSALFQIEAALERFRAQNNGHLVLISSMSAARGMPKAQTAYAASKAALSSIGQGLALEFARSPIRVTTILPGYIATDINKGVKTALMTSTDKGVDALVKAIDKEPVRACVPAWPWVPIDLAMRYLPEPILRRVIPG